MERYNVSRGLYFPRQGFFVSVQLDVISTDLDNFSSNIATLSCKNRAIVVLRFHLDRSSPTAFMCLQL